MHPCVVTEFRMEGGHKLTTLSRSYNTTVNHSQSLSVAMHLLYIRSTDESHWHLSDALHLCLSKKASKLTAIGVATNFNIHCRDSSKVFVSHFFRQLDKSGTSAEHCPTAIDVIADGFKQSKVFQKSQLSGALASRNHETVFLLLPVCELSHLETLCTKPLKHLFVLDKRSLQGQYCNSHSLDRLLASLGHQQFYLLFVDANHCLAQVF